MAVAAYDKRRVCQVCGCGFVASRRDAKFCKPACRKAAERDRKLLAKKQLEAMHCIDFVRGFLHDKDYKLDIRARRALKEIRDYAEVAMLS